MSPSSPLVVKDVRVFHYSFDGGLGIDIVSKAYFRLIVHMRELPLHWCQFKHDLKKEGH